MNIPEQTESANRVGSSGVLGSINIGNNIIHGLQYLLVAICCHQMPAPANNLIGQISEPRAVISNKISPDGLSDSTKTGYHISISTVPPLKSTGNEIPSIKLRPPSSHENQEFPLSGGLASDSLAIPAEHMSKPSDYQTDNQRTDRMCIEIAALSIGGLVDWWLNGCYHNWRYAMLPNDQKLSHAAGDSRQPETRSENCQT